jgi:hypothetical protein
MTMKRRHNKSRKYTKSRRHNKSRKHNNKLKARGLDNKVLCVMCEKNKLISDTFVPQSCFRKNLHKAHRICVDCWWSKFAKEDVTHACPGCKKGLPLNNYISEVIEISD